jgi:hypothetical protein
MEVIAEEDVLSCKASRISKEGEGKRSTIEGRRSEGSDL